MFIKVTFTDFVDAFHAHGREDQFSYPALKALFAHLEEMEAESSNQIELEVIARCCEYQESTVDEIFEKYDLDVDEVPDTQALKLWLQERTDVIAWVAEDRVLFAAF